SGLPTNHNVTITGIVTDYRSGVASLQVAVDGGTYSPVSFETSGNFSLTTALALDGTDDVDHTVQFLAYYNAGNSSCETDFTFTLDTAAPTITITSPAGSVTTGQNLTVTGQVADDRSGVASFDAALDGAAFAPVTFDKLGNFTITASLPLDGTA